MAHMIKLGEHERIVAVVPQRASGPGWANSPTWVHIVDHATGKWRQECLQPEEHSAELLTIYSIGALLCQQLITTVECKHVKRAKKTKVRL